MQPGGRLLSSNELQLCITLNLPPTKYITIKTILLSGATTVSNDPNYIENHVKKYLVNSGWLKKKL